MDIEQVKQDIESWIENFVEVPHPSLGGFAPCPYARQARLKRTFEIYLGTDPYYDLKNCARYGMGNREVIIYAYDPAEWSHELFSASIESGTYALALVQCLSDLNAKAQQMASKGFYHNWPEEYLQGLFNHRQDPR